MSCNPAIGGLAKGQLVKEIDVLGGIMGAAADFAGLQFKILNRSKGRSVWSPRAQVDKRKYEEAILINPRLTNAHRQLSLVKNYNKYDEQYFLLKKLHKRINLLYKKLVSIKTCLYKNRSIYIF